MNENLDVESEDTIVIEDENGNETNYTVDAIIEMKKKKYIIYSNGDQVLVNQLIQTDEEELLEEVSDEEMEELLNAYDEAIKEDETT